MRELRPLWIGLLTALAACVPGEVGDPCGSRGLGECARDQYCSFPESAACGEADAPGACAEVPEVCTKERKPVCGCDGETYDNACVAASAGVSVRRQGECDGGGEGTFCGGLAGIQCPTDQFCNFPPEALCGAADQGGSCARKPELCTLDYNPVCGCDDKTYGNACAAASAGVSVLHAGECTP